MNFGQVPIQKSLFQPNLNIRFRLKSAMRASVALCPLSRAQIVDEMAQMCRTDGITGARGNTISLANLDAWLAESKGNMIPIALLPAFCRVVGDISALSVLAEPLGGQVIDGHQARVLAYGEIQLAKRKLAGKTRQLLSEIEGTSDE